LTRLVLLIFDPGFFGGNFEDYLRRQSRSAHFPSDHIDIIDPFDYGNIGSEWMLFRITRLIEVEVVVDSTLLSPKEPVRTSIRYPTRLAWTV
jgi:hypothetical protein